MRRSAILVVFVVGLGLTGVGEAKEHGGKEHAGAAISESATATTTPPGLAKQEKMPPGLEKQHKTPQGWTKGKKTGWKKSPKPAGKPSTLKP